MIGHLIQQETTPTVQSEIENTGCKLDKGTLFNTRLSANERIQLKCVVGQVWVSRSKDEKDYVLNAGESLSFPGPAIVLAQGLKDSIIETSTIDRESVRAKRVKKNSKIALKLIRNKAALTKFCRVSRDRTYPEV